MHKLVRKLVWINSLKGIKEKKTFSRGLHP